MQFETPKRFKSEIPVTIQNLKAAAKVSSLKLVRVERVLEKFGAMKLLLFVALGLLFVALEVCGMDDEKPGEDDGSVASDGMLAAIEQALEDAFAEDASAVADHDTDDSDSEELPGYSASVVVPVVAPPMTPPPMFPPPMFPPPPPAPMSGAAPLSGTAPPGAPGLAKTAASGPSGPPSIDGRPAGAWPGLRKCHACYRFSYLRKNTCAFQGCPLWYGGTPGVGWWNQRGAEGKKRTWAGDVTG